MQFYWCTTGIWYDLLNDSTADCKHPLAVCAARRFGPHIFSKLVRSAILCFSGFRKAGGRQTFVNLQYLAQFYQSAREAIDRQSYVELAYACYSMCLYELLLKRCFSKDWEKHAIGFLISYDNLVRTDSLSGEEINVMSHAYDLISQGVQISSSHWHKQDNWLSFPQINIQRLEAAASRIENSSKSKDERNDHLLWIPRSHHLFRAEEFIYQLCTLFDTLSTLVRNGIDRYSPTRVQTTASIVSSLSDLSRITFQPPTLQVQAELPNLYVLRDDITELPGDRFTRQLLCLYYIFELQYQMLVQKWSGSTHIEVVEISRAICRISPPQAEGRYPAPDIRFVVHRGLTLANYVIVESHNIGGRASFIVN